MRWWISVSITWYMCSQSGQLVIVARQKAISSVWWTVHKVLNRRRTCTHSKDYTVQLLFFIGKCWLHLGNDWWYDWNFKKLVSALKNLCSLICKPKTHQVCPTKMDGIFFKICFKLQPLCAQRYFNCIPNFNGIVTQKQKSLFSSTNIFITWFSISIWIAHMSLRFICLYILSSILWM